MRRLFTAVAFSAVAGVALAATPAPEGAEVYIISPKDGAKVSNPVVVEFGLKGMGIAPAGVQREGTGHHHLFINVDTLPQAGVPIPVDAQHIHFGGGQTRTELTLKPGTYTLQLDLGDHNHVPFEPRLSSKKITIQVK